MTEFGADRALAFRVEPIFVISPLPGFGHG